MKKFHLKHTEISPMVNLDPENGLLIIKGRSLPNNAEHFYEPVSLWAEKYIQHPAEKTTLILDLEYFNTSTSKALARFLLTINKLVPQYKLHIQWMYDEEDSYDYGLDLEDILNVKFDFLLRNE